MNEFIAAATLLVTAAGVWLAYSYSRQMALKLSETRLKAYSRLWELSGFAAPTRLDGWAMMDICCSMSGASCGQQ